MRSNSKRTKLKLDSETLQHLTLGTLEQIHGGIGVSNNFCSQPCDLTKREPSWCVCKG